MGSLRTFSASQPCRTRHNGVVSRPAQSRHWPSIIMPQRGPSLQPFVQSAAFCGLKRRCAGHSVHSLQELHAIFLAEARNSDTKGP